MAVRIAVNGLGRIGRCVIRAAAELKRDDIEIVAANGTAPLKTNLHLLKFDSVHGPFPGEIKGYDESGKQFIEIGGRKIIITSERDPEKLPWKELGIDIVLECTGIFEDRESASKHLKAGAKKVLISAPSPDPDATIVYGVNNNALKKEHQIVSVGSCTTNCLAPVAKVLNDGIGIESGYMTTIHAYTRDQEILDSNHRDLRRARAAHMSIIPTSTGAAKALGLVLPEIKGKLDGTAVRVPVPNVSMVDLTFIPKKPAIVEEINCLMKKASESKELKGVLGYSEEPLVSIDFTHDSRSSIFDASLTKVVGDKLCRVVSWYDNEWGFSCRMLDVAKLWSKL